MKCKYLGLLASAGFAALLFTASTANADLGPPPPPIFDPTPPKVTGGGEIQSSVVTPGPGPVTTTDTWATFGFNAQPGKSGVAKGNFNYVNHVSGLHVNGSVDHIEVVLNPDGSPTNTVLFSGTWKGGTFIVTVEDNGEPGSADKIGITVNDLTEAGHDLISQGNIQVHKS